MLGSQNGEKLVKISTIRILINAPSYGKRSNEYIRDWPNYKNDSQELLNEMR